MTEIPLDNTDYVTIIEALQIARERTGDMVRFIETHPPNPEDESGYKEAYETGLSSGRIFLQRSAMTLMKFAAAGATEILKKDGE